jgi:hypothetical protein
MSRRPCTSPVAVVVAVALALALLLPVSAARAAGSEAEAKQVAATSNCKPGKITVIRQVPGSNGETIYQVTCTDFPQMFVLVRCLQRLCVLLH